MNNFIISKSQPFNNKEHLINYMHYLFRTDSAQKWTNQRTQYNEVFLFNDGRLGHRTFNDSLEGRKEIENILIEHLNSLPLKYLKMFRMEWQNDNEYFDEEMYKQMIGFMTDINDEYPVVLFVTHVDQLENYCHCHAIVYEDTREKLYLSDILESFEEMADYHVDGNPETGFTLEFVKYENSEANIINSITSRFPVIEASMEDFVLIVDLNFYEENNEDFVKVKKLLTEAEELICKKMDKDNIYSIILYLYTNAYEDLRVVCNFPIDWHTYSFSLSTEACNLQLKFNYETVDIQTRTDEYNIIDDINMEV